MKTTTILATKDPEPEILPFSELEVGDYFLYGTHLYRKCTTVNYNSTSECNCISVETGVFGAFSHPTSVYFIPHVEIKYSKY